VKATTGVELDYAIGLEMHALGVVAREQTKRLVETVGVARKREREVGKVVGMYLGLPLVSDMLEVCRRKTCLVSTGGHDPVAIVADPHAVAGLLEIEVLQQLHAVRKLGVVLQTPRSCVRSAFAERLDV
jgi:hypothetical protein